MASVEAQQKGVQDAVSMSSPPSSPISGARRAASRKIDNGVHVQQNSESESPVLHSCVLRLRVEDRLLAEDVRESLESSKDRFVASQLITSQVENLFTCTTHKPAASPSPLGTNTRSSAGHTSLVWGDDANAESRMEFAIYCSLSSAEKYSNVNPAALAW